MPRAREARPGTRSGLCGINPKTPRHRADAATETTSHRWRGARNLISTQVRATASGLKDSRNVLVVAHYDFISAFLDAVLVPETTGEFARWRHHNTAVTVLDIEQATGDVALMKVNAAPHIYEADDGLLSGFPL